MFEQDVEKLGKQLGYTQVNKNFHNVSLGQGQEVVAENAMAVAAKSKSSLNQLLKFDTNSLQL